ncbi:DHA2 family efflux MFS transporter permease subunit [Nocardia sp. NPDC052316]|uniref:DHA2 family efflux MFS transporter permease subunit n=1 Tax=Nocardia sp. NPDC052316 TaxID=3364329 RepID=UPI0037C5F213
MTVLENRAAARRWLGLVAIALGVALIVVDTTIVNVVLPSIIEDLGVTSLQGQWVQESYAVLFAALLLVAGRVADSVGARRVFLIGVVCFGLTSLLAGLAGSGAVLVLARFLQGASAALILPTSLSLLNQTFTGKSRNQAFTVWGSTIGIGTAVGPLLGSWLAEHASWRWAFGINIPLTVLVCVGVLLFLAPSKRQVARVDGVGVALSVVGLGLAAFGLVEGRTYGWGASIAPLRVAGWSWGSGPSPALSALIAAGIVLGAFVLRQMRQASSDHPEQALVDVRLFSVASFRNGNLASAVIALGEFGLVAVLPLWLQFALGYSPVQTGLTVLAIAGGGFLASGASYPLTARLSPLAMLRIGLVLEGLGLAALAVAAATETPWWQIIVPLIGYGVGVGFATAQVTNVVLAQVPAERAGQGAGVQSAFRQLGSALGIAVLTSVFFTTLDSGLRERLSESELPADAVGRFARAVTDSAGATIGPLGANPQTAVVADAARAAMTDAVTISGYLAAGFVLLGVVATLLIPSGRAAETADTETERARRAVKTTAGQPD